VNVCSKTNVVLFPEHVVNVLIRQLLYVANADVFIVDFSLEMMDKVEPPAVADGYGLSVAFVCMLDIVKSIQSIVQPPTDSNVAPAVGPDVPSSGPSSTSDTGIALSL